MKKLFILLVLFCTSAFAQLSGTYSIGTAHVPSETGNYLTLSAAAAALNAGGVSGPCTFYFTDNATYSDTAVSLGCTGTSATNTITFKPYTGVTATIDFTSLIGKTIDGMWVIGSPTNASTNLVPTSYVIIDGSNTIGGTTKDLTIQNPSNAAQRSVFRIYGDNDNITIKNCIIINRSTASGTMAPIQTSIFTGNLAPDNYTIQNNTLTSVLGNGSLGLMLSQSGTVPITGSTGVTIANNIISHRGTRGIMCNYVNDANIYGNSISADMQSAAGAGAGIWLSTGTANAGTYNIYNNQFSSLKILNNTTGASNGYIAIDNQFATPKVVNIYNNFIAGFTSTAAVSNSKLYGIRQTGSSTSTISHNTIYFPEMTDMTTFGNSFIAGIAFASGATTEAAPSGTCTVKNNIIFSGETVMKIWGIRRVGTNGNFTSDYNNIYLTSVDSGFVGYYNASDRQTMQNWRDSSLQDANSKNVSVAFASATDLHLVGASNGDVNLIGATGLGIATDIDGDVRSGTIPYMGADEASTPLPVELNSFTATSNGNHVELQWKTATEVNNLGFEVERTPSQTLPLQGGVQGGGWSKIGFVAGAGNSNSPKSYSFVDAANVNGTYSYRLKQIDRDGKFTYSNAIEVHISAVAEAYELAQNYPNPFNP
ncbi:MAG: right-handed parallel beta-helix repeat-containing protein, partial [Bacteroidota bacterium]|nr:right-handed parallel beta-helix repeat-containing protein [Bacteroidota bacterium]